MRYFVRGVDNDGHAANYVETEQLVGFKNTWGSYVQVSHTSVVMSFLLAAYTHTHICIHTHTHTHTHMQTRGSIPLYWSQRPTLKYKPRPKIAKGVNHVSTSVEPHS